MCCLYHWLGFEIGPNNPRKFPHVSQAAVSWVLARNYYHYQCDLVLESLRMGGCGSQAAWPGSHNNNFLNAPPSPPRASNEGFPNVPEDFTITEKAPTRAFSWFKAATTAFTFKTLLRHYAKRALTPRSLNVGPRRKGHKGLCIGIPISYLLIPWGQRPFSIVS